MLRVWPDRQAVQRSQAKSRTTQGRIDWRRRAAMPSPRPSTMPMPTVGSSAAAMARSSVQSRATM